ncbi:2-hydroxy-3-keto-5-methylthiopentenyl-1-phosphate phosphatase [Gordoniibacillus kamchatkensis]|uniref:2-hydroxy-3-keto-5-methylthiopentenyl-1-phosphate phosphatase n=1 Tax=Gordoniibacillus kamchatkensis TaxID=1590651 RepID=A0ABR5AGT8_9BACL|nr:2-hydroxy-3-keto-5-methylthiopentenyl-1-phosphate phosphatase [Paenibacillus sp. VKM B-2647]KIL40043.1 2-hydroxy-3-keto-5-methylthiopentenyl-1-phosphate phosphatase [Paenibacillus sp. VKM B-2647]
MKNGRQKVIFCDFDGTITGNDNIVAIMKHFDPEGAEPIVKRIIDRSLTVKEGVGAMFALLPTSRREEIVHYAIHNATIRAGFAELLAYCKEHDIKFLVTSGGIDFFVYPLLEPFGLKPEQIYCNASDFSGDRIRIVWPHPCDEHCDNRGGCGMCKTAIIRSYPQGEYERIMIGDSITDFPGAKLVDTVFARSHLIDLCEELKLNYYPFETFHDVIGRLKEMERA